MTALLRVSSIETLYFDRIYALFGVSLEIEEGEIFTVLGPNGAGKTTLLRTIAGLLKDQPKKGEIHFAGRRIDGWQPEAVARLGIVYVPEDRGLFRELSVEENLDLGLWGRRDDGIKKDLDFVYGMFPILKERAKQEAETLSGGEQQMLALARALCREPKVLLADELSLGLAPLVVTHLLATLRAAAHDRGVGILLVEQHVRQALSIADRVYVMDRGNVTISGPVEEIRGRLGEIEEAYLSRL
jgi:branched-chain amino acid transport system ATP-binding protein